MTMDGQQEGEGASASSTPSSDETIRLYQMLDLVATKVIYCDKDLIIRYVNRPAADTLRKLEPHLPRRAHELVGCSIDVFHSQASSHRARLFSLRGRKHRAVIALGPEKLAISVATVTGTWGLAQGYVVTWEVVTERLLRESVQQQLRDHVERVPIDATRLLGKLQCVVDGYEALRGLTSSVSTMVRRLDEALERSKGVGRELELTASSRKHLREAAQQIDELQRRSNELEADLGHSLRSIEAGLKLVSMVRERVDTTLRRSETYTRENGSQEVDSGASRALNAMAIQALRSVEDTKRAAHGKLHPEERRVLMLQQDELLARVRAGSKISE